MRRERMSQNQWNFQFCKSRMEVNTRLNRWLPDRMECAAREVSDLNHLTILDSFLRHDNVSRRRRMGKALRRAHGQSEHRKGACKDPRTRNSDCTNQQGIHAVESCDQLGNEISATRELGQEQIHRTGGNWRPAIGVEPEITLCNTFSHLRA